MPRPSAASTSVQVSRSIKSSKARRQRRPSLPREVGGVPGEAGGVPGEAGGGGRYVVCRIASRGAPSLISRSLPREVGGVPGEAGGGGRYVVCRIASRGAPSLTSPSLPREVGNAVHLRDFGEGSKTRRSGLEEPEARARDRR